MSFFYSKKLCTSLKEEQLAVGFVLHTLTLFSQSHCQEFFLPFICPQMPETRLHPHCSNSVPSRGASKATTVGVCERVWRSAQHVAETTGGPGHLRRGQTHLKEKIAADFGMDFGVKGENDTLHTRRLAKCSFVFSLLQDTLMTLQSSIIVTMLNGSALPLIDGDPLITCTVTFSNILSIPVGGGGFLLLFYTPVFGPRHSDACRNVHQCVGVKLC